MTEHGTGHEAEEIKEVVWKYTGWAVILLICIGAGVFIGHTIWGEAAVLRTELDKQIETVNSLKNERETLKSQLALEKRDKEECQRKLLSGGTGRAGTP